MWCIMGTSPFSSGGSSSIWSVIIMVTYIHGAFSCAAAVETHSTYHLPHTGTKQTNRFWLPISLFSNRTQVVAPQLSHHQLGEKLGALMLVGGYMLSLCSNPGTDKTSDHGLEAECHVSGTPLQLCLKFISRSTRVLTEANKQIHRATGNKSDS
ncbi:uncharacterized [Tachysurus ichikawai]